MIGLKVQFYYLYNDDLERTLNLKHIVNNGKTFFILASVDPKS